MKCNHSKMNLILTIALLTIPMITEGNDGEKSAEDHNVIIQKWVNFLQIKTIILTDLTSPIDVALFTKVLPCIYLAIGNKVKFDIYVNDEKADFNKSNAIEIMCAVNSAHGVFRAETLLQVRLMQCYANRKTDCLELLSNEKRNKMQECIDGEKGRKLVEYADKYFKKGLEETPLLFVSSGEKVMLAEGTDVLETICSNFYIPPQSCSDFSLTCEIPFSSTQKI